MTATEIFNPTLKEFQLIGGGKKPQSKKGKTPSKMPSKMPSKKPKSPRVKNPK